MATTEMNCLASGGSNVVFQNGGSYGDISTNGKPNRAIISFNYST